MPAGSAVVVIFTVGVLAITIPVTVGKGDSCRHSIGQLPYEFSHAKCFLDPPLSIHGIGRIKINFDFPAFRRCAYRNTPEMDRSGSVRPGGPPISGDWDGDKATEIGAFQDGNWYLDMDGSGAWNTGDTAIGFGSVNWTPVPGDWNGDGKTEIGIFLNGAGTWIRMGVGVGTLTMDCFGSGRLAGPRL